MKVLLVGNYLPDKQESMQRFADTLHHELSARGHQVRMLRPPVRLNRAGKGPSGAAKWLGYLDKFVLFPPLLRRAARRADVVHICDHSNAPYVRAIGRTPHLLTCNDVLAIRSARGLVPHHCTSWSGKLLQRYILSGINRAHRVACISENTRVQLLDVSQLLPQATTVIAMGQNYSYAPTPIEEAHNYVFKLLGQRAEQLLQRGFVLHVGGNQWYKNRLGVLGIYDQLCRQYGNKNKAALLPVLVMAGKPFSDEMRDLVRERGLQEDVISVEDVSNEELRALYSLAAILLFPSLAEGFGWPVIEAQACGCRVVTSNRAPLTDIGGDAAVYVDPDDHENAARCLNDVLNESPAARVARVETGLQNAARFSTAAMIDAYERAYAEVIKTTQCS